MKPAVTSLAGKHVLVTGAASGIGLAVARAVCAHGARVVLTDIDSVQLADVVAELGDSVLYAQPGDISNYEWVRNFADACDKHAGTLDVVMNIAGVSAWGTVDTLAHSTWRSMVDVNLMGPIHVIECFVPQMITRGAGGHVVNVSSAAGLLALPWHAAYSASKFGIRGVSEVLRFDLQQHNIGVSLVCPGAVQTPLVGTVDIAGIDRSNPRIAKAISQFEHRAVSPEIAAEAIIVGIIKNRFLVYTSTDIRVGYWVARKWAFPYEVAMRLANSRFTRLKAINDATTDRQG